MTLYNNNLYLFICNPCNNIIMKYVNTIKEIAMNSSVSIKKAMSPNSVVVCCRIIVVCCQGRE